MIRRSAVLLALLTAAACTPQVPDSGAGVGFQDYNTYIHNTYVPPAGTAPAPAAPAASAAGGFDPAAASAAIDRASGAAPAAPGVTYTPPAAADGSRPRGDAPAGIKVESGEMGHAGTGISDEQDFEAVAARETIASDKERIEQNRAQYVVVQPKDLPVRPGDTGPNIADYALKTTNNPGTPLYHRSGNLRNSANSCAKFTSPDLAQQAFLAKGGPDRDRLNLDPDGDGFACGWDPRPFRKALQ
jgi:hypothetical protein